MLTEAEEHLLQRAPIDLTNLPTDESDFVSMLAAGMMRLEISCPHGEVWYQNQALIRVAKKLHRAYSGKDRSYHGAPHPVEMNQILNWYNNFLVEMHGWEYAIILFMIAFHDAIYHIPGHPKHSNEES